MSARTVIGTLLGLSIVLAASGSMKAQEPKVSAAPKATASESRTAQETPAQAVARLVEQLKRHPVQPKAAPDRVGLYLMDLTNGEVTLIADQPAAGLTQSRLTGLVARWPSDPLRRHARDPMEPDPIGVDRPRRRPADRDGPWHRQLSHLLAGRRPHRVPVECRWCTETACG